MTTVVNLEFYFEQMDIEKMLLDEVEENSYKLFEGLLKKEIRKYVVSQVCHRSRCNILYSTFVCR